MTRSVARTAGRGWSILSAIAAVAVAMFFFAGAIGNALPTPAITADYARWGYPAWFHFVTAACELGTASLLLLRRTRFRGVALGSSVMLAATGTTLLAGEPDRAVAPVIVLLALATVAGLTAVAKMKERGMKDAGTDHGTQSTLPILYLLRGCPFSLKALMFLAETGQADDVEIVAVDAGSQEEARVRVHLSHHLDRVSFPTLEIDPETYLADSDAIVDRFAAGVRSDRLPAFSFYIQSVMPVIEDLWNENHELKARPDGQGSPTPEPADVE